MSILIKGMEMPKYGCDHCFLRTGNYCGKIEKNEVVVEYAKKSERHPDCPLVHVPLHGDLIDRDALYKEFERSGWFNNADRDIAEDALLDASTIIEGE